MIVGNVASVLARRAAQDGVGEVVAVCLHFIAAVDESVRMLCGINGVQHNGEVTAGGVLHARRKIKAANRQTVLLILYAAGADCHIGQNIGYIAPVFGIEHFIGSAEAGFGQRADVHMAHRDQTVQEILFFFGVGLMNNTLVAVAGGTGLIGVNSRNQDQAVGYLVVDFCKTVDIIADRILVICRAGTDDD